MCALISDRRVREWRMCAHGEDGLGGEGGAYCVLVSARVAEHRARRLGARRCAAGAVESGPRGRASSTLTLTAPIGPARPVGCCRSSPRGWGICGMPWRVPTTCSASMPPPMATMCSGAWCWRGSSSQPPVRQPARSGGSGHPPTVLSDDEPPAAGVRAGIVAGAAVGGVRGAGRSGADEPGAPGYDDIVDRPNFPASTESPHCSNAGFSAPITSAAAPAICPITSTNSPSDSTVVQGGTSMTGGGIEVRDH